MQKLGANYNRRTNKMRTIRTKVYKFDELSKDAQETAIEKNYNINFEYDWWEFVFEDAKEIGLKLTEFDVDRGSYCKGEFINDADYCAEQIIKTHGESCETYKTASTYLYNRSKLDIDEQDDELADLDDEFLKSICEDYLKNLRDECEYLSSEDAIKETIIANEFEFTKDGRRI